jgi:hypothetical protein
LKGVIKMYCITKNSDEKYELHSTEDESLKPICTFTHEGWAKYILDALNSYERLVNENAELRDQVDDLLSNERYTFGGGR